MKKIVQKDDPILRKKAEEISIGEITSSTIRQVVKEMKMALLTQEDGIAIAAPQIGESLAIFLVNGKLLKLADPEYTGEPIDIICINPKITKRSRSKVTVEEGCLSVRWLYGKIRRSTQVTITAYDEHGRKFTRGASGLLAQIFQHEIDHLEGILFIDSAEEVWEMTGEEIEQLQRKKRSGISH